MASAIRLLWQTLDSQTMWNTCTCTRSLWFASSAIRLTNTTTACESIFGMPTEIAGAMRTALTPLLNRKKSPGKLNNFKSLWRKIALKGIQLFFCLTKWNGRILSMSGAEQLVGYFCRCSPCHHCEQKKHWHLRGEQKHWQLVFTQSAICPQVSALF